MITISHTYRSSQTEIMDDFNLQGEEMKRLLTDLKVVNTLLGGTSITLDGIKKLLKGVRLEEEITILDIGCGDGELLRKCAGFGTKQGYKFRLIGIDANEHILEEARKRSQNFENISFETKDVFSEENQLPPFDIGLCTLFLHHFTNDKIVQLLNRIATAAKVGIVVNDLERSKIAFGLFRLFGSIFLRTKIARHDGLVSIARAFKKEELVVLSEKIKGVDFKISWKWAFRYQWILRNKQFQLQTEFNSKKQIDNE